MDNSNIVPITQKSPKDDMYSSGVFRDGTDVWQPRGAHIMCIAGGDPDTVDAQAFNNATELSLNESVYMTGAHPASIDFDLALAKSVVDAGRKLRLFISDADYLTGYDVERIVELSESGNARVVVTQMCCDKSTIPYLLTYIGAVIFLHRTDDPIYALSMGFSEDLANASLQLSDDEALIKDATGKRGIGTPSFYAVEPSRRR